MITVMGEDRHHRHHRDGWMLSYGHVMAIGHWSLVMELVMELVIKLVMELVMELVVELNWSLN